MRKINKLSYSNSLMVGNLYFKIIVIISIIFVFRLTQLMLFKTANGQDLTKLVNQLYKREEINTAKRGNIYDVSGDIIATDVKVYSVYAVLTDNYPGVAKVEDKVLTSKRLSQYLKMSEHDILEILNTKNVNQIFFGNAGANLSYDIKEAIQNEKLAGIYFEEKISRNYPKGYFSSNIIGLARDMREDTSVETYTNNLKGVMGIELMYNAQLTGIDGVVQYEKDARGIAIAGTQKIIEPVQHGNNIYTTIDSKLNEYLEILVEDAYKTYKPKTLNVMVVRPKSGDVVAVTQRPTFNAQTQNYPENGWVNQLVENSYEPGSTMKALLLAAAVNEGVFSPMDLYRSGSIEVGGIKVNEWNTVGWGTISYLDGLAQSSNVAFVNLVAQIGYDKWKAYLDAFGFGKSTQSGFANESKGTNSYSGEAMKATTSFGQGISVTNLQMVQAFTAIANEGKVQKLRFVDRVENPNTDKTVYTAVQTLGTPITPQAAKQTLDYLKQSVYRSQSTASVYHIPGVDLAIKTGTAQIYDEAQKKYLLDEGNYIYSMVAYLPADNPQYLIYMTMEHNSSFALQPIFKKFSNFALTYINTNSAVKVDEINTTQTTQATIETIPDAVNASVTLTRDSFAQLGFKKLYFYGTGQTVIKQMPLDNQKYRTDDKMMFYTGGSIVMPDMTGWSYQDVMRFGELFNVSIQLNGQGYVSQQSIPYQTIVEDVTSLSQLNVTLSAQQTQKMTKKEITTTTTKPSE